jgi:hypothetical protein
MYSVAISHKQTGQVVHVRAHIKGQNYTPSAAEYHAQAWKAAVKDGLIEADANKDDYAFEMEPVSIRDVFSQAQPKGKSS